VVFRQGGKPHADFDSLLFVRSGQAAVLVDPLYEEGRGKDAGIDARTCLQVRGLAEARAAVHDDHAECSAVYGPWCGACMQQPLAGKAAAWLFSQGIPDVLRMVVLGKLLLLGCGCKG
jgi:hypothetical protein